MALYNDMTAMVRDLTKPDTQGGLGQGKIVLRRIVNGTPDPNKPWVPVEPVITDQEIQGAARGISGDLVGVEINGTVLIKTDLQVICEVPAIEYTAGDKLLLDGREVYVISFEKIPAVGVTAAVRFIVRG